MITEKTEKGKSTKLFLGRSVSPSVTPLKNGAQPKAETVASRLNRRGAPMGPRFRKDDEK